ncbi:ABC transporter ATP-binding protein, partial [Oleiphilus sp. HI0043]|uniref:ATP-binding cassette domain-containing protein n=5 Tax=Oleiphilus TaxID=141450 RepID=UPI000AD52830
AEYAKRTMGDFLETVHPQMRLVTRLNVTVWVLNSLLLFSISSLSIWLWINETISTGAIAVAIALALRLNGMSQWIMWEVSSLFENIGSVQDGISTLSKERAVLDSDNAKALELSDGNIDFQRISFEYESGRPVISELDLHIKAGEKIGLVGRSGAGKSTLVNLLLRFYDLSSGNIRIDGQAIADIKQESLREHIGM